MNAKKPTFLEESLLLPGISVHELLCLEVTPSLEGG